MELLLSAEHFRLFLLHSTALPVWVVFLWLSSSLIVFRRFRCTLLFFYTCFGLLASLQLQVPCLFHAKLRGKPGPQAGVARLPCLQQRGPAGVIQATFPTRPQRRRQPSAKGDNIKYLVNTADTGFSHTKRKFGGLSFPIGMHVVSTAIAYTRLLCQPRLSLQ